MGTPLPPNEPGTLCGLCWGVGKTFDDTSTPANVIMQLHDIQPGDDWNPDHEQLLLSPHTLHQVVTPCDWDIDDGIFKWNWTYTIAGTQVSVVRTSDSRTAFLASSATDCALEVPNALNDPFNVIAFDGCATIHWLTGGL